MQPQAISVLHEAGRRSLIHGLSVMHEALNHDLKTRTRNRTRIRTFHNFSILNAGSQSMWLMQPQR